MRGYGNIDGKTGISLWDGVLFRVTAYRLYWGFSKTVKKCS